MASMSVTGEAMPIYRILGEGAGWVSAALSIYAFRAKTMIPLRMVAVVSCVVSFISSVYGAFLPGILCNTILIPLNLLRLAQMRQLIADSDVVDSRPSGYEWLKPFMHRAEFPAGHVLFRRGDTGAEAYLLGSGDVYVPEHHAFVSAGDLVGEIGLLTAGHVRTASAICKTEVRAWKISFSEMEQLCLQNPEFCLHMTRVIVQRYQANLEKSLESHQSLLV
jgi:hypothetical protein